MTSNHHAPYDLGYTRATMALNRGKQTREGEQIQKQRPSSDCSLQPDYTKLESLVIADQNDEAGIASNRRSECCGEYVPGSCTHRPSHHGSR